VDKIDIGKAYKALSDIGYDITLLVSATDATEPTTAARIEKCEAGIVKIAQAFGFEISKREKQ